MDIKQLVQDVLDGNESGLVALAILREEAKIIAECIKKVEPTAIYEADTYTEKSFQYRGYSFEKRSGGESYSYKHIPKWVEAKDKLTDIEAQSKAAYKNKKIGMMSATTDGEEIILPEVTQRKDSIVIKKSK